MDELQDIYRLEAFVAVVEEGSLTAAVKRLHITQPALSSRLRLLEESVGCQLLERTGRGVRPTSMGQIVYEHGFQILKRTRELTRSVQGHLARTEGHVSLSGDAVSVVGIFPAAVEEFHRQYPGINFSLEEETPRQVLEDVQAGRVDIGIIVEGFEPLTDLEHVRVHAIAEDRLELIAASDHPVAVVSRELEMRGKKLLPMHINDQPMILFDERSAIRRMVDAYFSQFYMRPRVVMTLRSSHGIMEMVGRGIGLSVVSAVGLCSHCSVICLPIEGLEMRRRILVISQKQAHLSSAAEEFLVILLKSLSARTCAVT